MTYLAVCERARVVILILTVAAVLLFRTATADTPLSKMADALDVRLGVVPGAVLREQLEMHGAMHRGLRTGPHDFHVVVALFDAESGRRVENARVDATVTPLGMASTTRTLARMEIEGLTSYGNYFVFPTQGPYRIGVIIELPERQRPTTVEFHYEHP